MMMIVEWKTMCLAIAAIVIAATFALLIKSLLYRYRRPNGKKGGIISLHVTVAFAIVTAIALTTKDWFLTGLTVLLAYLIGRGRLDEGQHYMYQVVLGAIVGVLVPYGMFHFYYKWTVGHNNNFERELYDDKPEQVSDDRYEADEAPELRLDDEL